MAADNSNLIIYEIKRDQSIESVPGHYPVKSFPRKNVDDLCKQHLSGIHRILSVTRVYQEDTLPDLRSSRGHPDFSVTYCGHR